MKCTKCTDENMSLGILPYVKCNECDGTGTIVASESFDELRRNWEKTGLLTDVESNKHAGLCLCFEHIYEDIVKSWNRRSHAKHDKAFQNALFVAQKTLHPITIRYKFDDKNSVHSVIGSNGKIIEFSEEFLQSCCGTNIESGLTSIILTGILRS